ncbi:MAG: hypothetical protein LBF78_07275 [Treponema sp.]|jgi:hypothetical protein|nr:hypothetical protein [Treponema sp.]
MLVVPVVLPVFMGSGVTIFWAAVTIFPAVLFAFCAVLETKYRKRIAPVNEIIEAIVHDKPAFFPPKSVLAMYNDTKAAGKKVVQIRKRMIKTKDYIIMLDHEKKDDTINGIISKQDEYLKYFFAYYDDYCALYLNMRFQFYMAVIRDVLLAMGKIYKADIRHFIDTVKMDIKCMGYILRSRIRRRSGAGVSSPGDNEERFCGLLEGFWINTSVEGTMANFPNDEDDTDRTSKKQPAGKEEDGKKTDMTFGRTNASIMAINGKIGALAAYLITVQSNKIIGGTSPIDEENTLNIQKQKNDFDMISEHSKTLDDEYDRFMAEVELTEPRRVNYNADKG